MVFPYLSFQEAGVLDVTSQPSDKAVETKGIPAFKACPACVSLVPAVLSFGWPVGGLVIFPLRSTPLGALHGFADLKHALGPAGATCDVFRSMAHWFFFVSAFGLTALGSLVP